MTRKIGWTVLLVTLVGILGGLSAARARARADPLGCVESSDGTFCLCKERADVCAGERAVKVCAPRRANTVCCASPVGFCYCGEDPRCAEPDERVVARCGP
jgi:hypothetical protein